MSLKTKYLGLDLDHPIVASAGPVAATIDGVRRLEDAGAAAIVLPSIYEEEIEAEDAAYEALVEEGQWSNPETAGYFPSATTHVGALAARLERLEKAAKAVAVPVIASLNGSAPSGWVSVAAKAEEAGAAAIELNIYRVPAAFDQSAADVEARWIETVKAVRRTVKIPVAVKLGPWLTAPGHFAKALVAAGASGLVLFNRFYGPDIDLSTLKPEPTLELSRPYEMRQALMWIALLAGQVEASLAATGGVETEVEAVKYLLSGADVVMTTSALLRHGPGRMADLRKGLEQWMEGRGFASISEFRGLLAANKLADTEPLIRSQYMEILASHHHARA